MKYRGDAVFMKKKLTTIISYITIIAFVGLLVNINIEKDSYKEPTTEEDRTNLIIKYNETGEEENYIESDEDSYNSDSYSLPNPEKNKYIKVTPL